MNSSQELSEDCFLSSVWMGRLPCLLLTLSPPECCFDRVKERCYKTGFLLAQKCKHITKYPKYNLYLFSYLLNFLFMLCLLASLNISRRRERDLHQSLVYTRGTFLLSGLGYKSCAAQRFVLSNDIKLN